MKLIDTVTLYAAFSENEVHHRKASKIFRDIAARKITDVYFTDYILDEILTLLKKRKGRKIALKVLDELMASELEMIKIKEKHIFLAIELFRRYENLSFTDATTLVLMEDFEIKELYSFDSDFDGISGIIRLEE